MSLRALTACALSAAVLSVAPVHAAERTISVSDFDSLRVTGTMTVIVTESNATAIRVSGDPRDLESVIAGVNAQKLTISLSHFGWGSSAVAHGPLVINITTPHLRAASLNGSGRLMIAHMRAPRTEISMGGAGEVRVERLETETFSAILSGSGRMQLAGKVAQAQLTATGSGTIDAVGLLAQDVKLGAQGASTIKATASRSANAMATGASSISVEGNPACTVNNVGAGVVSCGK